MREKRGMPQKLRSAHLRCLFPPGMAAHEENSGTYQSIKTRIESLLPEHELTRIPDIIKSAASKVHKIMVYTYQFLKVYYLHHIDAGGELPELNVELARNVMKVMCRAPPENERGQLGPAALALQGNLRAFAREYFDAVIYEDLGYSNLNTALEYEATEVITAYSNNITAHFVEYVNRFVNVEFGLETLKQEMRANENVEDEEMKGRIAQLKRHLRQVKVDFLNPTQAKTSLPEYHARIDAMKWNVFPEERRQEQDLNRDLKNFPMLYLRNMVWMMREVEAKHFKIFHVFPQRTSIIPGHFRMDTKLLLDLCFVSGKARNGGHGKKKDYTTGPLPLLERKSRSWKLFFETQKKIFHSPPREDAHAFEFDHQILTDGVSCTLLLKRKDALEHMAVPRANDGVERYITQLSEDEREWYRDMNVVAIDPGKRNLIYAVNSMSPPARVQNWSKKPKKKRRRVADTIPPQAVFSYTMSCRRFETDVKRDRKILKRKKQNQFYVARNGSLKDILELEAELSDFNSSTLDLNLYIAYLVNKNYLNFTVVDFYAQRVFRKMRLAKYIRKQKSESKMLKNFEKIFGPPETTIIAFGDWQDTKHRKFHEPTPNKGIRRIFRRAGYQVFLILI